MLGAVDQYEFDRSLFHNCQQDREAAVASIARAIDASSVDDPLYFIVAGPMEIPYLGIPRSQPDKRRFVYCLSHSRWNDRFAKDYTFTHTKRSVIPSGVKWIQIPDQNPTLAFRKSGKPTAAEKFAPLFWPRDSADKRLRFLWERMVVSTRPDCSDAGMAWFLVTGDDVCEVFDLRRLLEEGQLPPPNYPRPRIRLEAEIFLELDGYQREHRGERNVSHRINLSLGDARKGETRIILAEPYSASSGRYDNNGWHFFGDLLDRLCSFTVHRRGWTDRDPRGRCGGRSYAGAGLGGCRTAATVQDYHSRIGDTLQPGQQLQLRRLVHDDRAGGPGNRTHRKGEGVCAGRYPSRRAGGRVDR